MSSAAPFFLIKQKQDAMIVVSDQYPNQTMTYLAWKVLRSYWWSVICPQFLAVDILTMRKLEESLTMMANHIAKSLSIGGARPTAGGVNVDVEWHGTDNNHATIRIFPRNNKYIVTLLRDELGNVTIYFPRVIFKDLASMNQARHVCGQVVKVATSMRAEYAV